MFGATAAVLQILHNSGREVTAVQLLRNQSLVRRKGKPVVLHKVSSILCICSWLPSVMLLTVTFPANQLFKLTLVATLDCPVAQNLFHSPLRVVLHKLRRWGWLSAPITPVLLDQRDVKYIVNLVHTCWKVHTV